MTDAEMDRILTELTKSRTLNFFERAAFTDALIDMSMGDAGALLARAYREHQHVNPAAINKMRGRDGGNGNALAAWEHTARKILSSGRAAEARTTLGRDLEPGEFYDPIAFLAWKQENYNIRTSSAEHAQRLFMSAYRAIAAEAKANPSPSLNGTTAERESIDLR